MYQRSNQQQPRPPQSSQQQSRIFSQPLPQMSQSSQMMQQPLINQQSRIFNQPPQSSLPPQLIQQQQSRIFNQSTLYPQESQKQQYHQQQPQNLPPRNQQSQNFPQQQHQPQLQQHQPQQQQRQYNQQAQGLPHQLYFQMLPPRHDFSRPVPSSAILEIKQINHFNTHFTIKAFVVYKSDIKQWSNNRGQGKLFNVTLMDKSGEIRATAFTFCVDKFYELLKENKAYYMTKLKVALNKNPIYQGHKYELHFENSSEVRLCTDTDSLDSELSFEFVTFEKLLSIDKDTHIVDKSGYEITVTIWRNLIDNLDCTIGSVIIIKSARVSDFRGKGLSTTNSTVLITNPSLPEATELSEWYSTGGSQLEFNSLSRSINIKEAQKSLEEIKSDKTLGCKEKDVDPYGYENHIKNQLWESYIFKVRTQLKTFNEKTVVNNNLVAISEIDYVAETNHLCEKINELEKL
ncbi:13790_t:CDS:10 [Entrophospora sp. SA101]|nr:13790_t:CDS:10 [Entrophospora sp. SA101]